MQKDTTTKGAIVGLDLSDKVSSYALLEDGKVTLGKVETTAPALKTLFQTMPLKLIALEVGTHSPWVSRVLKGLGHRVCVANPRQLALRKCALRRSLRRALARHPRGTPQKKVLAASQKAGRPPRLPCQTTAFSWKRGRVLFADC